MMLNLFIIILHNLYEVASAIAQLEDIDVLYMLLAQQITRAIAVMRFMLLG